MTTHPQTVSFSMRVQFNHMERDPDKPREIELAFDSFDKMIQRYAVERRRRKRGDKATSGQYRMHVTTYGWSKINSDDPHYTGERYADAISGKWFNM